MKLSLGEATTTKAIEELWTAQSQQTSAIIGPIQSDIFDIAVPAAQATDMALIDHYFGTREDIITTTISVKEEALAIISYFKQAAIPWDHLAIVCSGSNCERLPTALKEAGEIDMHIGISLNQFSHVDELKFTIDNVMKSGARAVYIDISSWGELVAIAETMDKYGVIGDDLLIVLPPNFVQTFHPAAFTGEFDVQDGMNDFLRGSLVFGRLDGFQYRIKDKFTEAWSLRFRTRPGQFPVLGASFAYDSVLAVGFALCKKEPISFPSSLENVSFRGASGLVQFELSDSGVPRRKSTDFLIGAFNVRQNESSKTLTLVRTSTYSKVASWRKLNGIKFVYRSGLTMAPFISQKVQSNDHIQEWALSLGVLSVNIILLVAAGAIVVLWFYRKEPVVRRSQPAYQCLICIGSMITAGTTATLSHYPTYTHFFHNSLCTILPWTFVVGQVMINSAEFAKLWRVNQVTSLIRIKQCDGISLSSIPLMLSLIPLIFWTALDRMTWAPLSLIEEIEYCTCDNFLAYAVISGTFVVAGVIMTFAYAIRSKLHGVPDDFQDGEYIARATSIQGQTLAWACLAYLVGLDEHGSVTSVYLWRVFIVAVLSLSPIFAVVVPKLIKAAFDRGLGEKIERQLGTAHSTHRENTTAHQSSSNLMAEIAPIIEEPSASSLLDHSIEESTIDSYFA